MNISAAVKKNQYCYLVLHYHTALPCQYIYCFVQWEQTITKEENLREADSWMLFFKGTAINRRWAWLFAKYGCWRAGDSLGSFTCPAPDVEGTTGGDMLVCCAGDQLDSSICPALDVEEKTGGELFLCRSSSPNESEAVSSISMEGSSGGIGGGG